MEDHLMLSYGVCTQWYLTYGNRGADKMAFNSDIIRSPEYR